MIFVDTSAWFARYSPRDRFHSASRQFFQGLDELVVTTDYVVDETLTLFKARGEFERVLKIGPQLLSGALAELIWVEPQDVQTAWDVFSRFQDKGWSFTDCVSYVIVQRFQIQRAVAFDEHFHQFGIIEVLP